MLEIGKVHKIDKRNRATVRFNRKTACENCNMCLKSKDKMYVELLVENTANAKVGDTVSVSMGRQVVLLSSIIAYLFPILLVAISLVLTRRLDEFISFGIAVGVLVISYVIIAFVDKWIKNKKNYTPRMVEIISKEEYKNGK